MSPSDKRQSFKKNSYITRKNRKNYSPKFVCHNYCEKGHIRLQFQIRNIKFPSGVMNWVPKDHGTNP